MARRRAGEQAEPIESPTLELQRILEAVVDPARRSILQQLYERPDDISCGNFSLKVARSTATHHFNVLRDAGLIAQYYKGTSHMNVLRRRELEEAFPGLLEALLVPKSPLKDTGDSLD